jgi:hypothetical protein
MPQDSIQLKGVMGVIIISEDPDEAGVVNFALGSEGTPVGLRVAGAEKVTVNGAKWVEGQASELVTLEAGETVTLSVADLLPANSVIEAVTAKVVDPILGQKAQGTLTIANPFVGGGPQADETVTVDSDVYTWKATLTPADFEVLIGATPAECAAHLIAAMTAFGTGYTAAVGATSNLVVVTWGAVGVAGNAIDFTETSTDVSADGTGHLGGTTAGTAVTTWQLGDSTTAARFTAAIPVATHSAVGLVHLQGGIASDATGPVNVTADKVGITLDAAAGSGSLRVTAFYRQFIAPTS